MQELLISYKCEGRSYLSHLVVVSEERNTTSMGDMIRWLEEPEGVELVRTPKASCIEVEAEGVQLGLR